MDHNTGSVVKEVLIVEDDEIIATLIERFLLQHEYHVTRKVSSGEDAIYACAEHIPDVVLMDISLKDRIDGITATKFITALFKVPVIFVSATDDDETLSRASMVEASSFIIKPFTAKDLYSNIDIAIRNDLLLKKARNFSHTKVQKLTQAMLSLLDAYFILDDRGRILFLNPYAEHILNIERNDAISRSINYYLTFYDTRSNEMYSDAFNDVVRESLVIGIKQNIAVKMKDGSFRHVTVKATSIRDSANDMIGMVMVLHLMTKREL